MESFGCFRKSGIEFVDQVGTSVVGGAGNGNLAREGVAKERLQHIISVTMQGVISCRVERYSLAMGVRHEARQNSTTSLPLDDKGANWSSSPIHSPD